MNEFHPPFPLIQHVGTLLISTLTSLKHAGAAFAAHEAFQKIALACLTVPSSEAISRLPTVWMERLLEEISSSERVRDSTLRRSTGYALGFLSIMRSEKESHSGSNLLCNRILGAILKLSLPASDRLSIILEKFGLGENGRRSRLFSFASDASNQETPVSTYKHEVSESQTVSLTTSTKRGLT